MKYLKKSAESQIIVRSLSYEEVGQRIEIRRLLIAEQKGFCAYSERYLMETDSIDIEHFDGRLKSTTADNYYNWYGVLTWLNSHKPKNILPFEPILLPSSEDLLDRITYSEGVFHTINQNDIEADNLIKYLGLNKPELFNDRSRHISRVKKLYELCNNDLENLKTILKDNKEYLSFCTALEHEFQESFDDLLQ